MQATLDIRSNQYYTIICRANSQAWTVQSNSGDSHHKCKITGLLPNSEDSKQVFMFCEVEGRTGAYEIVSCPSDYVLEEEDRSIRLKSGKLSKNQLFLFERVPSEEYQQIFYWIKCVERSQCALSLQGFVRAATFDPSSRTQMFRIEMATHGLITRSHVIVNCNAQRVIDVPEASEHKGERICIWDLNNRWNQRWVFQKMGYDYLIKNLISEMCLDIAGESREDGAKIIQWKQTLGANQLWNVERVNGNVYRIRSKHAPNLFLGVKKEEKNNGAYLEVTSYENASLYWQIEGLKL